jgi:hypothetical protein
MLVLHFIIKLAQDHTQYLQCKYNRKSFAMELKVQKVDISILLIWLVLRELKNQWEIDLNKVVQLINLCMYYLWLFLHLHKFLKAKRDM